MEEQKEEYEVLDSIYGSGDERFKSIGENVFQYQVNSILYFNQSKISGTGLTPASCV